ncbi:MAG: hypothetical protein EZS28_034572 [Streblomastix strix]|uniref:Uncharacterized protein n=1 Tax=Streblomastix strix TaxID=222440 RepID=A0A5J4UIN7_9EUKA|nr:MAG: hypothetical protein EZS28_034572 [Streblomastix strix]
MGIREIEFERRKIKQKQQEFNREKERKKITTLKKLKKTVAEIKATQAFGESKKYKTYFFEKDEDIDVESYLFDNSPQFNTPLQKAQQIQLQRRQNLLNKLNQVIQQRNEEQLKEKRLLRKFPELSDIQIEDKDINLDLIEDEAEEDHEFEEWNWWKRNKLQTLIETEEQKQERKAKKRKQMKSASKLSMLQQLPSSSLNGEQKDPETQSQQNYPQTPRTSRSIASSKYNTMKFKYIDEDDITDDDRDQFNYRYFYGIWLFDMDKQEARDREIWPPLPGTRKRMKLVHLEPARDTQNNNQSVDDQKTNGSSTGRTNGDNEQDQDDEEDEDDNDNDEEDDEDQWEYEEVSNGDGTKSSIKKRKKNSKIGSSSSGASIAQYDRRQSKIPKSKKKKKKSKKEINLEGTVHLNKLEVLHIQEVHLLLDQISRKEDNLKFQVHKMICNKV